MQEGRAMWAADNLYDNEKIETLTPEQHEVLRWLCTIRHEVHKCRKAFWYSEHQKHDEYWQLLPIGDSIGEINERLLGVGLNAIDWSFNPEDIDTSFICYELKYTEDETDEAEGACYEMANKFNSDIEHYLKQIDEEHKTHYCPGGHTRILI